VQAGLGDPEAHVLVAQGELGIRVELRDLARLELARESLIGRPE
jgi:hypothetical protein